MKIINLTQVVKSFFRFFNKPKNEGNISPSKKDHKSPPKIKRQRPLTQEDISALRAEMMSADWNLSEIDLIKCTRKNITEKEG